MNKFFTSDAIFILLYFFDILNLKHLDLIKKFIISMIYEDLQRFGIAKTHEQNVIKE